MSTHRSEPSGCKGRRGHGHSKAQPGDSLAEMPPGTLTPNLN